MIKLLHTADVHLDSPFSGSGLSKEQARRRRADLLTAFERICSLAREESVDAFLIAGDLFDEEYMRPETSKTLISLLEELSPMPVLISPGNHDPYHAASPYRVERWPGNVHVFSSLEPEKRNLDSLGLTVHGCAFTSGHVTRSVWQRFRVDHTRTNPVNVILTHGAFHQGEPGQAAKYLPITREELLAAEADYVALGHYHRGFNAIEDKFTGSVRAAYPGSPEPLKWGGEGEHGPLMVEIDHDQDKVIVRKVDTAVRRYREISLEAGELVTARDYVLKLRDMITELDLDERDLLRVRIEGRRDPRIPVDIEALAGEEFAVFAIQWLDQSQPDFDLKNISRERSVRGLAVKQLLAKLEEAEDEEKQVITDAINLLLSAFEGMALEELPL